MNDMKHTEYEGLPDNAQSLSAQLKHIKDDLMEFEGIEYSCENKDGRTTIHKFYSECYRRFEADSQEIEDELFNL